MPRTPILALALAVFGARNGASQDAVPPQAPSPWDFSGAVYASDPPGSEARTTAILYGDRGPLHLELRLNYEDLETASFFGGWTFEGGEEASLALTPMLGLVGGRTQGVAPGLMLDLSWRNLAWYVEAEYLFDSQDSDDDFFYSWSTLTWAFDERFAAGLVTERSKLVDTDLEVQPGLALELALGRVDLALYSYNLGTSDGYTVLSLGGSM